MKVEKCPRCTRCDVDMAHHEYYPCYVCPKCGCVATEKMKNVKELTVNEFYDLVGFYATPIKVSSAYNGMVLCRKYDPAKHAEIGARVLCTVHAEIQCLNRAVGHPTHAQGILHVSVIGDVEYRKAHEEGATK